MLEVFYNFKYIQLKYCTTAMTNKPWTLLKNTKTNHCSDDFSQVTFLLLFSIFIF